MVYNNNNQSRGGAVMANRTESYIKLNKESIRGTAEGVLVIFGDDQGYGHQVVKGGDHANLDMLKTIFCFVVKGQIGRFKTDVILAAVDLAVEKTGCAGRY